MTAPTITTMQARLGAVLDGNDYFEDFWAWLREQQFQVAIGSPEQRLLYTIMAHFEDYDAGHLTDDQALAALQALREPEWRPAPWPAEQLGSEQAAHGQQAAPSTVPATTPMLLTQGELLGSTLANEIILTHINFPRKAPPAPDAIHVHSSVTASQQQWAVPAPVA